MSGTNEARHIKWYKRIYNGTLDAIPLNDYEKYNSCSV